MAEVVPRAEIFESLFCADLVRRRRNGPDIDMKRWKQPCR